MSFDQGRQHILLVEDDESQADLIVRIWRQEYPEVECHHVSDGAEALDFLYRRGPYAESPCPLVVLLDLRIPRVDGLEVLREIKASDCLRQIPVIVLTSSTSPDDIQIAYECYANAYLKKPENYEDFCQLVRIITEFWLKRTVRCPNEDKDGTMLGA